MKRYTLQDWLAIEGNTQTGLAKTVGVTQGAINQMAASKRQIFVIESPDGLLRLEEVRPIEGRGKKLLTDPTNGSAATAAEA